MNKPLALALFVGGAIFGTYGVSASDEIDSGFSRIFTRAPTHKNTWLIIGGGVAAGAGLIGMLRGARADFLAANRHARMHPRFSVVPHDPAGALPEPAVNRRPVPVSITQVSHSSSTHPNSHEK